MSDPAVLVGFGARTSVGLDLAATDAAVRANLNAFGLSPWLRSKVSGEPLTLARLATLPPGAAALDRMRLAGVAAATEALAARKGLGGPVSVVLSVPPRRPGFPVEARQPFFESLVSELPCKVDRARSGITVTGHEGGVYALAMGARFTLDPAIAFCLVIGVESYMDPDLLDYLDSIERLKRDGVPNGFIPGEGAGAVLMSRLSKARASGLSPGLALVAAGRATEPDPWYSGRPTLAKGLTSAIQATFARPLIPTPRAEVAYCDFNGEAWRPDEWAYAYLRTAAHHGEPIDLRSPATSWGDVGAATGPLMACLASRELPRRADPSAAALLWAASDMKPTRSACLIRRLDL